MKFTEEQLNKVIHKSLHSDDKILVIGEEHLKIEIGLAGQKYIQWQDKTFEKASPNSPGKAGELISRGVQVTICKRTGRPWTLITNIEEEGL